VATAAMTKQHAPAATDDVLVALEHVSAALAASEGRARQIVERSNDLARQRAAGQSWRDIAESESNPRTADLLRDSMEAILRANSRYRRALVKELYGDGVTMQRIAELLGITRQRVAVLLKDEKPEKA